MLVLMNGSVQRDKRRIKRLLDCRVQWFEGLMASVGEALAQLCKDS